MKITTASGSVYEIDSDKKQIRRLNGKADPSPRMGKDGQWRAYKSITAIEVGQSLVIVWGSDVELLPETKDELADEGGSAFATTITSALVSIDTSEVDVSKLN